MHSGDISYLLVFHVILAREDKEHLRIKGRTKKAANTTAAIKGQALCHMKPPLHRVLKACSGRRNMMGTSATVCLRDAFYGSYSIFYFTMECCVL